MNDITDRDIVRGADGDHRVLSIRRAGESNGWAVARGQINMSAVRQCEAHNGYSCEIRKPAQWPMILTGSVNDVGPVVQADGNGVGNSCRDTAKNCWRAGDPAGEVTSCNFLPLREQFH